MAVGLGVDVGTTHTKVSAVGVDPPAGPVRFLASETTPTPTDAEPLAAAVLDLLTRVTERLGERPAALGLASMAETGCPLDRSGRPLLPLVRWQDVRTGPDAAQLAAELGHDALFTATGVRCGPKPPLVVWRHLRRTRPDLYGRMRHWAGVADWLHLVLTGALRTDHTLAGRTGAYRLPAGDDGWDDGWADGFDPGLLALAGLSPDQVPTVAAPGAAPVPLAGAALPALAGLPVTVAGHDHQVAAWAAGVRDPGGTADSVGTAEAVLTVVETVAEPLAVARQGMSVVRTVAGRPALLAGSGSAGAFLTWYADHADLDLAALLDQAAPPPAGPSGWTVLPYPSGRQCPEPDPGARAGLPGHPLGGAALVEALAYQAEWMIRTQLKLAGQASSAAVVLGELPRRAPGWLRVKASLADRRTTVARGEQTVAAGAALLALVRAGAVAPEVGLAEDLVEPLPAAPAFRMAYDRFVAAARQPFRPAVATPSMK